MSSYAAPQFSCKIWPDPANYLSVVVNVMRTVHCNIQYAEGGGSGGGIVGILRWPSLFTWLSAAYQLKCNNSTLTQCMLGKKSYMKQIKQSKIWYCLLNFKKFNNVSCVNCFLKMAPCSFIHCSDHLDLPRCPSLHKSFLPIYLDLSRCPSLRKTLLRPSWSTKVSITTQ